MPVLTPISQVEERIARAFVDLYDKKVGLHDGETVIQGIVRLSQVPRGHVVTFLRAMKRHGVSLGLQDHVSVTRDFLEFLRAHLEMPLVEDVAGTTNNFNIHQGNSGQAIVGQNVNHNSQKEDRAIAADQRLYDAFMQLLPQGASDFLLTVGSPFDPDGLDSWIAFLEGWGNAEHTFHNPEIERCRQTLHQAVKDLIGFVAVETFDTNNGRQGPAPEWKRDDPGRYQRVVDGLQKRAAAVVTSRETLIAVARRTLKV